MHPLDLGAPEEDSQSCRELSLAPLWMDSGQVAEAETSDHWKQSAWESLTGPVKVGPYSILKPPRVTFRGLWPGWKDHPDANGHGSPHQRTFQSGVRGAPIFGGGVQFGFRGRLGPGSHVAVAATVAGFVLI